MWSAVELPFGDQASPWPTRLAHALRPMLLVDLAAFALPLAALAAGDHTAALILRLIAFLKIARYSPALQSLGRVIALERAALLGAGLIMLTLLLVAGAGMYLIERHAQPDRFGTLPDALWWALVTLATVGYGDVYPVTALGKLFTAVMVLSGVGVFALPVGIIVTGFTQDLARRDFVVTWTLVARVPVFANLDAAALAQIMALLRSETFEAGEEVVRTGEPAQAMYFIASGEVAVDADGGEVRLGQGDFFGEMALIERRAHTHAVTAMTRCRLLVLEREDFERLGRRHPQILERVRATARSRAGKTAD